MAQTRLFKTQKSPYWQAEYYDRDGQRHRDSTRCTDKRAAADWLRNREREVHDPAYAAPHQAPRRKGHSVAEALSRLVEVASTNLAVGTVRMYAEKGGHLVRVLVEKASEPPRSLDVNELQSVQVQRYLAQRLDEGAARETVRKELCTLSQALKLAKSRGLFLGDPRALIPEFKAPYRGADLGPLNQPHGRADLRQGRHRGQETRLRQAARSRA